MTSLHIGLDYYSESMGRSRRELRVQPPSLQTCGVQVFLVVSEHVRVPVLAPW